MNKKLLEVVNSACQSKVLPVWSVKVIGQFRLNGIGCKTCVKFVIGHWSVAIHLLYCRQIILLEFRLLVSFTAWISHL